MASYSYYGQNYGNPYYYPVGYQPIQNVQQTMPQQNVQPVGQSVNQPSIIWIGSEQEAIGYPVAPNNAVTLWSTSEPVVYLKQADATGKPTLKTYDLVERKPVVAAPAPSVEYATKNDLMAVAGVVKGYDEMINTLQSDLEAMKTEFYSKRPARKKDEVAE